MTEKRFTMNEDGYIWDNEDPISQGTVLNRLNALNDENEQLKKRLDKVLQELYCKDRKLEKLGEDIECCDKKLKGDVE